MLDTFADKHSGALGLLNTYLQEEAKDKKAVMNTAKVQRVSNNPLRQPNMVDCGLYLLHFAKTFLSDPEKYLKTLMSVREPSIPL